jgi:predicted Zn-dependent protease
MAIADPPLSAYGRRMLAQTALYRGQWASAERQLQSLIDAGPSPGDGLRLRLLLAQLHQAQNRQGRAVAEAERALSEAPPAIVQATDLRVAGTLWARAQDLPRARRALVRLEAGSPGPPSRFDRVCILSLKGEIAAASGEVAEAAKLFAEAWSEYPQPEAAIGQARALAAARDWANAARAWEQVLLARGLILRSGFGSDVALTHRERAAALARAGDGPGARKSYEEFLRIWKQADADVLRAFRIESLDGDP